MTEFKNQYPRLRNAVTTHARPRLFLNMRSSAILRPCVLVLRHHRPSKFSSDSQERKYRGRMKVPGCVLDIEDVSSVDLRESSHLKSQKTLRVAGVRKPVSFKLALVCFILACFDLISIFIHNSTALEVESKHLSFYLILIKL